MTVRVALFALRLLQQAVEEDLPKELCRAGLSYLPQTLHPGLSPTGPFFPNIVQ